MNTKVLMITGSYPPMRCGVGGYAEILTKRMRRRNGLSMAVLTSTDAASNPPQGSEEHFFPLIRNGSDIRVIWRVLRQWRPDLIHIQFPTMGYANWGRLLFKLSVIAWLLRIPVIATWHEPYRFNRYNWISIFLQKGWVFVRPNYFDLMPSWFRHFMRFKKHAIILTTGSVPVTQLSDAERKEVRTIYGVPESKKLIVYFGFAYPNKAVHQLFEIADPARDHLLLLSELRCDIPYQQSIRALAESGAWSGHVTLAGYVDDETAGRVLASADAAVLPFAEGGGEWNSTLHTMRDQGLFLVGTSQTMKGYYPEENIYYAAPGNIPEMRAALAQYMGRKNEPSHVDKWSVMADAHAAFYQRVLGGG